MDTSKGNKRKHNDKESSPAAELPCPEEGNLDEWEAFGPGGPAIKKHKGDTAPESPFNVIQEAQAIWSQLRLSTLPRKQRTTQTEALMTLIRGQIPSLIFRHNAARVVQCAIKYGSVKQRDEIAKELEGRLAELAQTAHGRSVIGKLLACCSNDTKTAMSKEFYTKVRDSICHVHAAEMLEEAYGQPGGISKNAIMGIFYGSEATLLRNGPHTSNVSLDAHMPLSKLMQVHPEMRIAAARYLRQIVDAITANGFESVSHLSILHRALFDYLTYAEDKDVTALIPLLKDHLIDILRSREGAQVTQLCILHATTKERKHIIKSLKTRVCKVACEPYGHTVLLTIFESVDDTELVDKRILSELMADGLTPGEFFFDLMRDRHASRVILFLLAGRNRFYQPAYMVDELEGMDAVRERTTKKEDTVRRGLLLKAVSRKLLDACTLKCGDLLLDPNGGQVLVATLYHAHGDKASLIMALAERVAGAPPLLSEISADPEEQDLTQHAMLNRKATSILKDAVKGIEKGAKKPAVDHAISPSNAVSLAFSTCLAKILAPNLLAWLRFCASNPHRTSGAALVLVALLESGSDVAKDLLNRILREGKKQMLDIEARVVEALKLESEKAPEPIKEMDKKQKMKAKALEKSKARRKDGAGGTFGGSLVTKTGIETFLEAWKASLASI
ncbi:hypothetical protein HKX48_003320 [Thoreauomyces humboldtii]|nr:hypothetical protein HKX48_003320 [Thoreauomyces humboldtii]